MEKTITSIQFTKDKPVLILTILGSALALLNVILTLIRLNSHDFKVPVQYVVNDGSVLQISNWYSLYSLALVSVLGAGAIVFLAHRLHKQNRLFAIGVLLIYLVVAVIGLLATNAILGLVNRV